MGCFTKVKTDVTEDSNPIHKMKKKLWRIRNCGLIWMSVFLLVFIVGILLLVYFAHEIPQRTWKRGVGITGIVFLLLGLIGLAIGIILVVVFIIAFKRSSDRMSGNPRSSHSDVHKKRFPAGTYPVQPGFVHPEDQQNTQATAPTEGEENKAVTPDEIVVEPTERY